MRLKELVEAYEWITIYRHVSPDSDAFGSQLGLKLWIEEHYPDKHVYALGNDQPSDDYFPAMDCVDDDIIRRSLAIIVDTANAARVDDLRYQLADYTLKIDHHVLVDSFADEEIVDEKAGATCQLLAGMFEAMNSSLSKTCAQYLYGGVIADTLKFSIQTTSADTLRVAAYLLSFGVDIPKVNEKNFSTTLKQYRFENYIRANCELRQDALAYMIVTRDVYEGFALSFAQAKEKVFVMGGVAEFKIWALFTEKEKNAQGESIFNGSLRSKMIPINDIANRFDGGGHRLACGVKNLTREDITRLLEELMKRINEAEAEIL